MTDKTSTKASALLTAESVIIAFLFAYAPVFNSTLVSLMASPDRKPFVTTVWAGLAIFGLILTGFCSIVLLVESIDVVKPNDKKQKYGAGKCLFFAVILGSISYVLLDIVSILHYAGTGGSFDPTKVPPWSWLPFPAIWVLWVCLLSPVPFMAVWLVLVWFRPLPSTQWLGRRADCIKQLVRSAVQWRPRNTGKTKKKNRHGR